MLNCVLPHKCFKIINDWFSVFFCVCLFFFFQCSKGLLLDFSLIFFVPISSYVKNLFLQLLANTLVTERKEKKTWGQKHVCACCWPVDQEVMRHIIQVWLKDCDAQKKKDDINCEEKPHSSRQQQKFDESRADPESPVESVLVATAWHRWIKGVCIIRVSPNILFITRGASNTCFFYFKVNKGDIYRYFNVFLKLHQYLDWWC